MLGNRNNNTVYLFVKTVKNCICQSCN